MLPASIALSAAFAVVASAAAATSVAAQTAPPASRSIAVEADAAAYALRGYSGILRLSFDNGLNIALGAGRYDVPGFIVERQDSDDEAGWKATSETIQVLRVGYRFGGPMRNGAVVDAIVINQRWKLEAERLGGETRFNPLSVGLSGGYYLHVGRHFYLYPTASFTYNDVYRGSPSVQGRVYEVARFQVNGSLHVGWEWSF